MVTQGPELCQGAGLGVGALSLWVWSTEEMQPEPWMRKTKESPKCQVQESRCWARIRWEAEAGLLRMSKMGPQVQEAVQGRVPETQGSTGQEHNGGCH